MYVCVLYISKIECKYTFERVVKCVLCLFELKLSRPDCSSEMNLTYLQLTFNFYFGSMFTSNKIEFVVKMGETHKHTQLTEKRKKKKIN